MSGQIPIDPKTGNVIQGDIKAQAKQVMENAKAILAAAGCDSSTVVKATIYLKNMDDFAAVNEVYGQYFPLTRRPGPRWRFPAAEGCGAWKWILWRWKALIE